MAQDPRLPPLPGNTLEDLPEHRREALLWRFAPEDGYDEVAEYVQVKSQNPCKLHVPSRPDTRELVAVLGDDGRYHLRRDQDYTCGEHYKRLYPGGPIRHRDKCPYWADTEGRAFGELPPGVPANRWKRMPVKWAVTMTEQTLDPQRVPRWRRCVALDPSFWPVSPAEARTRGRDGRREVRRRLIDRFGTTCAACGHRAGDYIDHDHFTNVVRGLVCQYCNTWLDQCPHLSGCRWADYLNDPPAAGMKLQYPDLAKTLRQQQWKVERMGIDPFLHLRPGARRNPARTLEVPDQPLTPGADPDDQMELW